jgi:hypothetical protein
MMDKTELTSLGGTLSDVGQGSGVFSSHKGSGVVSSCVSWGLMHTDGLYISAEEGGALNIKRGCLIVHALSNRSHCRYIT